MENSEEGCILKAQQEELRKKVVNIDSRLTQVEHDVGKMRSETQEGFKAGAAQMNAINVAVTNLGHDFGERMNGFDKRLVTEKEKWGETFRWVVKIVVRLLVAGCAVAMGVTAIQHFMEKLGG
jgi:outer membrane murein-binding lipoprotein Lpp